jgi:hypothetical protein
VIGWLFVVTWVGAALLVNAMPGIGVIVGVEVAVPVAVAVAAGSGVAVAFGAHAVCAYAKLLLSLNSLMVFAGSTTARFRMNWQPGRVETTIVIVAPPWGPLVPPVQEICV